MSEPCQKKEKKEKKNREKSHKLVKKNVTKI